MHSVYGSKLGDKSRLVAIIGGIMSLKMHVLQEKVCVRRTNSAAFMHSIANIFFHSYTTFLYQLRVGNNLKGVVL